MFADFLPLVMDSLINQATKYWYLSNEKGTAPIVIGPRAAPAGASGRSTPRCPFPGCSECPG